MSYYIWAGVAAIASAWAITVTLLLILTANRAVTEQKRANYWQCAFEVSEDTVQDLLRRLDQLDPMNEAFIQGVLDLANDNGGNEARIIPFRQVGDLEV